MGLAIGIGNGILFTSQRGISSIIPGLIDDLCARATYCENKTCTTATLAEIAAVRYTAPVLPTGLLADYPGAGAAYSLRNLIDTTTSVVRVRRSLDNTEQDFTSEEITDGTLAAFCSGTDGFVPVWYDQSGNTNNATQTTAVNQPKLVNNGVVILKNLNPLIEFNDKHLEINSAFRLDRPAWFSVLEEYTNGNYKGIISFTSPPNNDWNSLNSLAIHSGSGKTISLETNRQSLNLSYGNLLPYSLTSVYREYNDTEYKLQFIDNNGLYENYGSQISSTPTSNTGVVLLGERSSYSEGFNGMMQEVIFYNSDNVSITDVKGIKTDINKKYSIYPETPPPTSGLLFDYPGANAAFSLRNLSNTTTRVVRIRRSNDNTEQDFTATEITDGTLTTFTGANDGFLTKWYDQSNEDPLRWASQNTAIYQPKLVSNGILELENGKPTLKFSGSQQLVTNKLDHSPQPNYCFIAFNHASGENFLNNTVNGNSVYYYGGFYRMYGSQTGTTSFTISNNMVLSSNLFSSNGVDSYMALNGTLQNINTGAGNVTQKGWEIGDGTKNFIGTISEVISYPSDQSSNRTGIETNINTEYTIY